MIFNSSYGHNPLTAHRRSYRIETGSRLLMSTLVLFGMLCGGGVYAEEDASSPAARYIQERIKARQDDRRFTCQGELICGIDPYSRWLLQGRLLPSYLCYPF